MKKIMMILVLGLAMSLGCKKSDCQSLKVLDKDYGFINAKFEMPISSFKNLKEYSIEPTSYISTTDNLKLAGYDLEYIQYFFDDD